MRKVIFGGANTVDNYIAGKDDSIDWIRHSKEVNEIMKRYWETMDTVILGRRTWEIAMGSGSGGGSKGIKTYVCSRTLKKIPGKKVELAPDAVSLVKRLKSEEGKDIMVMGGSLIGKSLFEAGLVDEFGVNIHPVLLGSGIPLFCEMDGPIDLELRECKQLENGCVFLNYAVKH
ncbi:MAG TPA: dihydrofolate reductase family protein [Pyrinomonadaceae bacterium]|jgi:dihydrofolate reductase|nr:dihydrofolate reductase family protein [Pyrinomonadaceae bacterium]